MNGKLNLEWHDNMSIRTLAIGFWDSLEHNRREVGFEIDTHVVVSDDSEGFEEIGGVEPDDSIFSFDRGSDTDIAGSYLGISCRYLETGLRVEGDTGIVVVFFGDKVRSLEGDDEIITKHDPFG